MHPTNENDPDGPSAGAGADPAALMLVFSRCNAASSVPEWNAWMTDEHVPDLAATPGVRAGTHWALSVQPTPGMPSIGFSHVSIYELADDVETTAAAIVAREDELRTDGELAPHHSIVEIDLLAAHGRFCRKPLPTPGLEGHILAYVGCNDPRREAEWDAWNDDQHMPDMLDSNAFEGVTRWRRVRPDGRRARHATLYDVGPIGIDEAVARSAAVMPGIAAAGRKHPCHVGALTVTLVRA